MRPQGHGFFPGSVLLILFVSLPLCAAEAVPVVRYDASDSKLGADPDEQGWVAVSDRDHRATAKPIGKKNSQAWRMEDDDGDGPEDLFYRATLTDQQKEIARECGFGFRWRLRIPEETGGPTRAISTEVCVVRRDGSGRLRFGLQMGRRGSELVASVFAGTPGLVEGSVVVSSPDGFHEWSMLFDETTDTLNVRVDDAVLLATRFDHLDHGHDLVFGSRSTGTGTGEWSCVEFYTGLPADANVVPPPEPPERTDVFVSGQDGYFAYRIPSLVTTSKGTLLAFCEGRKSSLADLGNNDLVLKRSADDGKTWEPMEIVCDEGDKVTIGNPTPVVDRDTGIVWVAFSRNASDVLVTHSGDDGKTWSEPADITPQVKRPEWKFYAVGPGVGIQLRDGLNKGRLLIPAYHRTTQHKSGPAIAHVFYSDDQGASWKIGGIVGPHTCECQVVETIDADGPGLLLNARNHWARSGGRPDLAGKRIISRSRDGGQSWSEPSFDETLIEPTCQASLLRFSWPETNGRSRILFANPASRSRSRMTVRASYDEGRTWPISRLIDGGSSAYSCLSVLPDGRIGLLYESGGYKRITFAAFDLDWLTMGRDEPGS